MIHQAIGRGVKKIQEQQPLERFQTELALQLASILNVFLPLTSIAEIEATSKIVIEKAAGFKQAMTEEHALSCCSS